MDYFFKSDGCVACSLLLKILNEKEKLWSGRLKIVDVKFDSDGNLITYIDNKKVDGSPVSRVPAFYDSALDKLFIGSDDAYQGIKNASWNN